MDLRPFFHCGCGKHRRYHSAPLSKRSVGRRSATPLQAAGSTMRVPGQEACKEAVVPPFCAPMMTKSGSAPISGFSDTLGSRGNVPCFLYQLLRRVELVPQVKNLQSLLFESSLSACVRVAVSPAGSRAPRLAPRSAGLFSGAPSFAYLRSSSVFSACSSCCLGSGTTPRVRPPCMFKNAFASRPTPKALLNLKTGKLRPFFTTRPFHDPDIKLLTSGQIVKDYTLPHQIGQCSRCWLTAGRRDRVSSTTRLRSSPADGPLVDTVLGGEELAQLDLAFF